MAFLQRKQYEHGKVVLFMENLRARVFNFYHIDDLEHMIGDISIRNNKYAYINFLRSKTHAGDESYKEDAMEILREIMQDYGLTAFQKDTSEFITNRYYVGKDLLYYTYEERDMMVEADFPIEVNGVMAPYASKAGINDVIFDDHKHSQFPLYHLVVNKTDDFNGSTIHINRDGLVTVKIAIECSGEDIYRNIIKLPEFKTHNCTPTGIRLEYDYGKCALDLSTLPETINYYDLKVAKRILQNVYPKDWLVFHSTIAEMFSTAKNKLATIPKDLMCCLISQILDWRVEHDADNKPKYEASPYNLPGWHCSSTLLYVTMEPLFKKAGEAPPTSTLSYDGSGLPALALTLDNYIRCFHVLKGMVNEKAYLAHDEDSFIKYATATRFKE